MNKRELTYVREAICCDCGTVYGQNGPNGVYQDGDDIIILCDSCAGENIEEESEDEN